MLYIPKRLAVNIIQSSPRACHQSPQLNYSELPQQTYHLPSLGLDISSTIHPTTNLFPPSLQQPPPSIPSTPAEPLPYGTHPQQQPAVYPFRSPSDSSGKPAPIPVFIYSGSFVLASKTHPQAPLVHVNIGRFYAERGGWYRRA